MQDFIKAYGSMILTVLIVGSGLVGQWVLLGTRVTANESTLAEVSNRVDRQGTSITDIKNQLSIQASNYAQLSAKLDAMSDNVNYIRSRIDRVLQ